MTSLLTRPAPESRTRVAILDTAHSRRRSAVVLGPLHTPTRAELVDRLAQLADAGPLLRLCLEPSVHEQDWRHVRVDPESVITEHPALAPGAPPTDLLAAVRATRADAVADGIRILRAGEHLAIDFCHGLGEVPFVILVLDGLFGAIDIADPEFLAPYRHSLPPLLSAALRTFGSDPRRLATLLDIHRRRPIPRTEPDEPAPGPFAPAPATRFVGLSADIVSELRRRRDRTAPGVSLIALLTHALWDGFRSVGLAVDEIVKIPFDARRYLRPGADTLASFTAGLDFTMDPVGGPARLQAEMDRAARCGRPVANLMVGSMKARRGYPDVPQRHPARPRVRLLHSNVARDARTEHWPYTDHAAAQVLVASDPTGPEGVTVTSAWMSGNLWLTAEFHESVFDPGQISAALGTVETHLGHLTSSRLG